MSLANIQGRLSRSEMKNIMAGSVCGYVTCSSTCIARANCSSSCYNSGSGMNCNGSYYTNAEICAAAGC